MNDAGFYDDRYLGQPADNDGINTSTLLLVGLFHLAIAGLLLNSWTQAAHQEVPKLSTIKIQMLQLEKPAPPEIKPVEPLPEPIQPMVEPTPVVQKKPEPKPVVENELAFKRVEEKPIPKEVKAEPIKPKIDKPEKKVIEQVDKPIVQQAKPIVQTALSQPVKATQTAAASNAVQIESNTEAFSVERYKPIEKQAPEYPRGALRKSLEGDCTVRYTVNTRGEVESPEVLANCHPLFKTPSLEAAKKFRYSPRMINGQAVAVQNVHNTFEYRIQ